MIKRLLRELYLLPRGEQRALLLVTFLLILVLGIRITLHALPRKDPPGVDVFVRQAREILAVLSQADSFDSPRHHMGRLELDLPGKQSTGASAKPFNVQRSPINLNAADSLSLLPLPGIGPVLAGRIIKYRRLLGGFVSVQQVLEVYGISPETFGLIESRLYIDSSAYNSVKINTLDFRALLRHPYLEIDDVKRIVNFRDFSGYIISEEELSSHNLLPDSTLKKLLPYLDFRY